MRIDEISSAEDQIALFKLITDKVWQSLAELQRADAEAKAAKQFKAKPRPTLPKKSKPPAARPLPKSTIKPPTPAKLPPQPARAQPFTQQSVTARAPSTKQKQSVSHDKESQSADFY